MYFVTFEWSTDYYESGSVNGSAVWVQAENVFDSGLNPGHEEVISVKMADGSGMQDGVSSAAAFMIVGAALPMANVRTWFRATRQDGSVVIYGGTRGVLPMLAKSGVKPLGEGKLHTIVSWEAEGAVSGSIVAQS